MKKKLMMPAVLGAVLLAACQPVEPEKTEEFGTLTINLANPALQTKSDVTALACESKVNKMRVMIYDSSDKMVLDEFLASPFTSLNIDRIKVGQYSVYAMANSCATISSLAGIVQSPEDFNYKAISLSDCSLDENTGFVMFDRNTSVTVTSGTSSQPVNLSVTRFPARIRLVSVTNSLPIYYGSLTVDHVMIINGYSRWNIAGHSIPFSPMNEGGRNSTSGEIIATANAADYPDYSFWEVPSADQTVLQDSDPKVYNHCFYSFPNQRTTDVTTPAGEGGKMRLVVVAQVLGQVYYYPVTLSNVERNKSYDVQLTISGLGSDDPNVPVQKGAAGITIGVSDWGDGSNYTETI